MDIQIAKPHRLYNGGDRISESLTYSLPDGHDIHCVARWQLNAPERDFFPVPQELRVGASRITVNFLETILRGDRMGRRGVIWVNAEWEPPADEEEAENMPVAKTDKEAVAKAGRYWKKHLLAVAQAHIDQCQLIRSQGGVPLAAHGFTKRALREVGWVDPAEAVLLAAQQAKASGSELEEIKRQMEEQRQTIEKLLASQAKEKPHKPAANA